MPKAIQECRECPVLHEVADPDAQCARCPKREKIDRYPRPLRHKVGALIDLWDRMQAGFRVGNDDITLDEWRAIARIRQFYELRQELQLAGLIGGRRWQ